MAPGTSNKNDYKSSVCTDSSKAMLLTRIMLTVTEKGDISNPTFDAHFARLNVYIYKFTGDKVIHFHTEEKPYKSDMCSAQFGQTDDLKRYIRSHTEEKPKCDTCGALFAKCSDLKKHTRIHTGEKPYKCEICDAKFSRIDNLNVHTRTHTGVKPYECDTCCVRFLRRIDLKMHIRILTLVRSLINAKSVMPSFHGLIT